MYKDKVIIIPVHNQLHLLKECIESVLLYTENPKIIVIDDGSDKETQEWIIDNCPIVIRMNDAMGFSYSCNKGIDYAIENYDFNCLCLLNSDTRIESETWFRKVEECFIVGDKIGIAGVMSDNALAQTVKNKPEYIRNINDKPTVYSYLIHGFCYFIGIDLLMTIGHLDEYLFPHYGSEDDYSMKSLAAGYKNLVVGSVFIHHHNSASYSDKQRNTIIKRSAPDFHNRWGINYINRCGVQSVKVGNYINNK